MAQQPTPSVRKHERYLAYVAFVAALIAAIMSTIGTLYTTSSAQKQVETGERRKERIAAYSDYLVAMSAVISSFAETSACAPTEAVENANLIKYVEAIKKFRDSAARIDLVASNEVRDQIDVISSKTITSKTFQPTYPKRVEGTSWQCTPMIFKERELGDLVSASRQAIDLGRKQLKLDKSS